MWNPNFFCPEYCQGPEGHDLSQRYLSWVALDPWWMEGSSDTEVYFYDIEARWSHRVTDDDDQYATSTDGHRIVWMDDRNGNWDIYMYDIEQEREVRLTTNPFDQVDPHVAGDLVVFRDYRFTWGKHGAGCAADVYVLDLDSMVGRRVTTNPWFWSPLAPISRGRLLATDSDSRYYRWLWIFDLIQMGILDSTGRHVVPE